MSKQGSYYYGTENSLKPKIRWGTQTTGNTSEIKSETYGYDWSLFLVYNQQICHDFSFLQAEDG